MIDSIDPIRLRLVRIGRRAAGVAFVLFALAAMYCLGEEDFLGLAISCVGAIIFAGIGGTLAEVEDVS